MNKKGMSAGVTVAIVLLSILVIGMVGGGIYLVSTNTGQSAVKQAEEQAKAVASGDYAQISVSVRDISALNENTKLAVAVYCVDDLGNVIIDGTSSSTSADIKGSTARNRVVSCYAFNSTVQTSTVNTERYWNVPINQDSVSIVIDAFTVATVSEVTFYNEDGTASGTAGVVNATGVGANDVATLEKLKIKNNQSYKWLPIAGVYLNQIEASNVSSIDFSGATSVSGASFIDKTGSWGNSVSARRSLWDFVMGANGGANTLEDLNNAGVMPIILEDGDSITTNSVKVTGNGDGCSGDADLITSYVFTSGFFRSSLKGTLPVQFGYQTNSASASALTADITGATFYATA
jgi:hypothetical protein